MNVQLALLFIISSLMAVTLGVISIYTHFYSLNKIKSKIIGDGQYGTARFATQTEIKQTFKQVPYQVDKWRKNENLPTEQGIVIGCQTKGSKTIGLVDSNDVHAVMIGAAGVGKTAYFCIRI